MLLYHPMYDPYHCAFRILTLIDHVSVDQIEIEKIRIADFYYLFPHLVAKMRLPKGCQRIRKMANLLENEYIRVNDAKRTYEQIKHIQLTALRNLAAHGALDPEAMVDGLVKLSHQQLPIEIQLVLEERKPTMNEVQKFITEVLLNLPLLGKNGLKDRSGLMEYRYDVI